MLSFAAHSVSPMSTREAHIREGSLIMRQYFGSRRTAFSTAAARVSLLALGAGFLMPTTAEAHLGHLGEVGGHSHWAGAALLAGAAILAGIGALKGRKKAKDAEKNAPEAQADDAEPEAA